PRPGRRAARARLGDLRSCPRRGLGPSRRRHPVRARGPRMIRPATTTLVLAGLCGALACGGRSADRAAVELWAMGREGEVVRGLVPDFERLNPDVRVRVQQIPWSAAHEKLLTAFVGGAMPDVFQAGNTWLPELAALGAIEPLDARLAGSAVARDDVFPGILDTNVIDGTTWGVPWYVDTRLLFYPRGPRAAAHVAGLARRHGAGARAGRWGWLRDPASAPRMAATRHPRPPARSGAVARRRLPRKLRERAGAPGVRVLPRSVPARTRA